MKFNIKDVKSWSNRHDVKIGEKGYFINDLESFKEDRADNSEFKIDRIKGIRDEFANCFISKTLFCLQDCFPFFLPLKAVKADEPKEKKYRPFESMAEFTKVVYNLVPNNLNITGVGESFTVRRKYNGHYEKVLITHLEYDENHDLLSINGQSLRDLFENYDIVTDDDKIIPFGVEVENE